MEAPKDLQTDRDAAVVSLGKAASAGASTSWLERLRQRLQGLTLAQRMLMGAGVATLVVMLLLLGYSARSGQDQRVLFANLNEADGAAIVAALQQMNVPYKFTEGGAAITVPQSVVYETRLKLAGQGLPKAGNVGFELLENQKFGTSQFVERVNYLRGLEGELARSITALSQVRSARVHLAVPKPTAFVREQEKPTASVVLTLHPGRVLDPAQTAAIARLVSSAVPSMQAQDVSIMDTEGGLLAPNPMRQAGLDASQLRYTADLENALTRRVAALLEPLTGKDGFRAQVTVELDFDERERTSEVYGKNSPPNEQAIRSQQTLQSRGLSQGAGGIPGALTNQPPEPPEAPIVNATSTDANGRPLRAPGNVETGTAVSSGLDGFRSEQTINYEVDRAIERLKSSKGKVIRVSAAVVMDHKTTNTAQGNAVVRKQPYSPEEIQQISNLVKDAIGYVQSRGDTVSVANLPFSEEPVVETHLVTPDLVSQLLHYGAIALAVLFAYFAIVRPLIRPAKPPQPVEPLSSVMPEPDPAEKVRQQVAEQEAVWQAEQEARRALELRQQREAQEQASRLREQELASKNRLDELETYARDYANQNREMVAALLRAWVSQGSSGTQTRG